MRTQGFLEDLFGLQVAAIGEIDVGLGDGIHIAVRIELTQGVRHRRHATRAIAGIDALTPGDAEERVGLKPTLAKQSLLRGPALATPHENARECATKRQQCHTGRANRRQQGVHDA